VALEYKSFSNSRKDFLRVRTGLLDFFHHLAVFELGTNRFSHFRVLPGERRVVLVGNPVPNVGQLFGFLVIRRNGSDGGQYRPVVCLGGLVPVEEAGQRLSLFKIRIDALDEVQHCGILRLTSRLSAKFR
jgi:hypothetical protein